MSLRPSPRSPLRSGTALRWPALLGCLLALAGCVRTETTIVVNDDGSGTAELVVAVDPQVVSQLSGGGLPGLGADAEATPESTVSPDAVCSQVSALATPADLPPGGTTEAYEADGLCGQRITFPFTSGEDLSTTLAAVGGTAASDLTADLALTREDGGWHFQAPVITPDQAALTGGEIPPELAAAVLGSAQVRYTVDLPGVVVDGATNADEVEADQGLFRWNVDLQQPPALLEARTVPAGAATGGGFPILPVAAAGVGGLALVGLLAVPLLRRRRRRRWRRRRAFDPRYPWPDAGRVGRDGRGRDDWTDDDWTDDWADVASPVGRRAATPDDPVESEPWWDDDHGVWLARHPVDGVIWYDEDSDAWLPV